MIYEAGQANRVLFHLKFTPEWLILGGPADGDEAECFVNSFPGIRVVAAEPDPTMFTVQRERPLWQDPRHALTSMALYHTPFERLNLRSHPNLPRSSSLVRYCDDWRDLYAVSITIDELSKKYGPFRNAMLWLDIEGSELAALQGASECFSQKAIDAVLVEIMPEENPDGMHAIEELLSIYGLHHAKWFNHQLPNKDRLFVRQK